MSWNILSALVLSCSFAVAQPLPDKVELDCGNGVKLKLVKVKAGKFTMGSPRQEDERGEDERQRQVTLTKDFWMGAFEVTQEQYEAVMGDNPSHFIVAKHPVDTVSWDDATEFCKKLSALTKRDVRLPTEAEWEYACRAGKTTAFSVGDGLNVSSIEANFNGNQPYGNATKEQNLKGTAEAGSYKPNAWGLHDMHGNVWEWCSDRYGEHLVGPVKDPVGPLRGETRVLRGGAWNNSAGYCRSALRNKGGPDNRFVNTGFRVVLSRP